MARNGRLIAIAPGSAADILVRGYVSAWDTGMARWPHRSDWLTGLEEALRLLYPDASRADLNLTARHLAPFPLRAGHDVP